MLSTTSLVIDYLQKSRKLYVFAGQRGKESLKDLFVYDVDNDTVQSLSGIDQSDDDCHPGIELLGVIYSFICLFCQLLLNINATRN